MDGGGIARELVGLGRDFWEGVLHLLPYFAAGVLIAAAIRTWRLHVRMRRHLPRLGLWGIPVGTFIGCISPLCACGVLPIMVSLLTTGLPLAPAMALLVASPLMSVEGYAVTAGLLGPDWANAKLVAAVFMGLFAGSATLLLARRGFATEEIFRGEIPHGDIHDPDCDHRIACNCPDKWSNRLVKRGHGKFVIFWAKAAESSWHVGKFTLVGLVVEVLAARYIPQEWFAAVFSSTAWYNVVGVLLASVPMHVNQFTAAAILYGPVDVLGRMGADVSWSTGMAFLIGGPVTALPAMGVFLSLFKPRVLWLYLAVCVAGTLVVAFGAQAILGPPAVP